jgi:hypothetical protein
MPHVTYASPLCPWPSCGFEFGQIDFHLELINQPYTNKAYWHGTTANA